MLQKHSYYEVIRRKAELLFAKSREEFYKKERVNLPEGKFTRYGSRDVVSYPYIIPMTEDSLHKEKFLSKYYHKFSNKSIYSI